jgi:predicted transcriptional regulator
MARKDNMLRAFLSNEEFCKKYNIEASSEITIYQAKHSQSPELVTLASIIDRYEKDNTTPLYQQVINLLNEKL